VEGGGEGEKREGINGRGWRAKKRGREGINGGGGGGGKEEGVVEGKEEGEGGL
jgi:hypothetical protein